MSLGTREHIQVLILEKQLLSHTDMMNPWMLDDDEDHHLYEDRGWQHGLGIEVVRASKHFNLLEMRILYTRNIFWFHRLIASQPIRSVKSPYLQCKR